MCFRGTRWLLPSKSPVPTTMMIVAVMVAIAVIASLILSKPPAMQVVMCSWRPPLTTLSRAWVKCQAVSQYEARHGSPESTTGQSAIQEIREHAVPGGLPSG